jgi:hypothetical protein
MTRARRSRQAEAARLRAYRRWLPRAGRTFVVPVKRVNPAGYDPWPTWVIDCPHCGREHVHGAKAGHRVAHCVRPTPEARRHGYYLVFADLRERAA